jgi:peptidoglycan hydrolase CwlO-like protein
MIIMGYQFRPPGAPDIDVRKLGLLFLIIVSVLVLYAVGTVVTGYSTYSASLEQELNATKEELRIMTAAREDCAQTLQNTNAQYNSCSSALQSANSNLAGCSNQLNATNAAYDECRSEVESLQVESFETRYNALV